MGWVTLFEPADLAALLHLPGGVETLGWLCLGWPDERNPGPGLERHGWSSRLALDDVVLDERWPASDAPSAPPSHLSPEPDAVVAARDSGDDLLAAPGSLGVLDATVDRVLALPGAVPTSGTVLLVAGDHPVAAHGVSAYTPTVTADVLAASRAGESVGAVTASAAGLAFVVHHAVPADEQGDLVSADALSRAAVETLVADGVVLGRAAAAHGLVCLGEVGIGNTTVAAALTCGLLGVGVEDVIGLGSGADAAMLERKRTVVASALARTAGRPLDDPVELLAALGGPEFAVLAGVTLGASDEGVPVVLDGLATSVAALLAVRLRPAARSALVAGQRSRERAHHLVLTELGLEPLLDLRLRAGEGVGACLAAQALLTALTVRRTAGRTR